MPKSLISMVKVLHGRHALGRRMRQEAKMGINSESDVAADLQIGPTSEGMVRIFVAAEGVEIPMDFEPEEALEIAEEIRAAALAITGK